MYQRSRKTENDVRVPDNYRGTTFVPPPSAPAPLPSTSSPSAGDGRIIEPFPRHSSMPVPLPIPMPVPTPTPPPNFSTPEDADNDGALPCPPGPDGCDVEPGGGFTDRPNYPSDGGDADGGGEYPADKDGKKDRDKNKGCDDTPQPKTGTPSLRGVADLFGGQLGLEELLLLGVIFLLFSDGECRDNELLICLLLILFI